MTDAAHRIIGPYEVFEAIGRGGTSVVYRARHSATGVVVALKVFSADLAPNAPLRELLPTLHHPNLVRVLALGTVEDEAWVAMEFVDGPPLDRAMRQSRFTHREFASLIAPIARALQTAHERGISHRDIKPGNILLTAQGIPKLSDFGLAKVGMEETVRQAGVTAGTPFYMSPEQAAGMTDVVDPRSDIYSLGVVLYEAMTGRPPLMGKDTLDTLQRIAHETPPAPHTLCALDPALEAIIVRAMARDPSRRYATAVAMAEALEQWRLGRPVVTSRSEMPAAIPHRRRPLLPVATLLFACILTIGMGAMALLGLQRTKPAYADAHRLAKPSSASGSAAPRPEARLFFDRAQNHAKANRFYEALLDYSQVIDLNPAMATAYVGRAYCASRLGQISDAESDLNHAIALDTPQAEWYIERAQARMLLGRWHDAQLDADACLRLHPNGPFVREAEELRARATQCLRGNSP